MNKAQTVNSTEKVLTLFFYTFYEILRRIIAVIIQSNIKGNTRDVWS